MKEQIDTLVADEGTKFLFDTPTTPTFKGFQPGASSDSKPGAKTDTTQMNYDELCSYLANNEGATLGE